MLLADLPPVAKGGVPYQADLLARTLTSMGHEVTAFITHRATSEQPYQVVEVPVTSTGKLQRFVSRPVAFARLDLSTFDVVHAHGDDWLLGRRSRVRTFYGTALMEAIHATSWPRRILQGLQYASELASMFTSTGVVISDGTGLFLPLARRCIPCMYDSHVYYPGTKTDWPSVLFVAGTLGGRKRGHLMLDAYDRVREVTPSAKLTIVSFDRVKHPGVTSLSGISTSELAELFRQSWVLCSTSSYEGFGVPYIEALASGTAILTTRNRGAQDVLGHDDLGLLCEPSDLPSRLLDLLMDSNRRSRMEERGLEAAEAYSSTSVASAYVHLYKRLAQEAER
jgi:glycosyltransferase involved in cell wall biosynthesis